MKVFKIYFLVNSSMILGHIALYLVSVMGLGSGNADAPRSEVINILLFMAALGASPNLLLFLAGLIKRKQVKENALWASAFTTIVLLGYLIVFWPLAMEYTT
ncbi:hypothetical protein ACSFXN_00880 [Planococcus sp. 1R117A]|uniref:hypothetical protein n=1 Tax=Planococcus sp. 1R117A TaxID=3447020 RepID=UPI003EDBA8C7